MIEARRIPISELAPNTGQIPGVPRNPRIIRDERFAKLVRSLKEDPEMLELRELLVYEHEGAFVVLGGNMRLKALKHLGEKEAPCKVIPAGWPAEKLRAIVTKDNVAYGDFDWEAIVEEWDRGELDEWGVEFPAITKAKKGLTDPDAVPEVPKEAVTRPGDIWRLGDHRIICGDSTQAHVVSALLRGEKPRIMVTDPPYGVEYDPKWRDRQLASAGSDSATGEVYNDNRADWSEAWNLFLKHGGVVCYVWHAASHSPTVADSLYSAGFELRNLIIWAKDRLVISRGNYHHQHEPCWYGVKKGENALFTEDRTQTTLFRNIDDIARPGETIFIAKDQARKVYAIRGDRSTLWEIPKPRKSDTGHSTQKPVECMARPIRNHDRAIIYEPFSGSGTTIIACEQSGRKCRAIELAPEYVDVAVKRWQDYTGKEAILEGTGETFAQRAEAQVATV